MAARVPEVGALTERTGIVVADPVRGPDSAGLALLANHLLGRGGVLVPAAAILKSIATSTTRTYRLTIWPRYQATHRAWLVGLRAASTATVTFTDPSGGASTWRAVAGDVDTARQYLHLETIGARTSAKTATSFTIQNAAASAGAVTPTIVTCFEVPRPELAVDASDLGVDLATFGGDLPIYAATGESLGGLAKRVADARDVAKRNALFQFFRASADALEFNTGSFVELLGGRPSMLDRYLLTGETTKAVEVEAYTRSDAGTTGDLRFTMTSGGTLTLSVTAADTGTWRAGTLAVHVEDLAVSDGRRASTWDALTVEGQRTGGAGKVYVDSISIAGRTS